jgi:hypothetical protein
MAVGFRVVASAAFLVAVVAIHLRSSDLGRSSRRRIDRPAVAQLELRAL